MEEMKMIQTLQGKVNTFHDASGLITVSIFQARSATAQPYFVDTQVEVAPDMVVIGGGAVTEDEYGMPIEQGALLTASYPNEQLTAWVASSKDHVYACPHYLSVYAIGLSIKGMSRAALVEAIHISVADSQETQHPEATAQAPQGFLLISGGFRVDWYRNKTGKHQKEIFIPSLTWNRVGNLATASFPSSKESWTARSKDHRFVSPGIIHSYAICLREELPVGKVLVALTSSDSMRAAHPTGGVDVQQGFAITGGGAEVHWHGEGNMLWKLQPAGMRDRQYFLAGSKDHEISDPATITTYALGIQIQQANKSSEQESPIENLKTILIIENDTDITKVLTQCLKDQTAYRIIHAPDGFTALKIVHTLVPDLILLDDHLPTMDSLEYLDQLRKLKGMKQTPVILMCASTPTSEQEHINVSMLEKPFTLQTFLTRIHDALSNN